MRSSFVNESSDRTHQKQSSRRQSSRKDLHGAAHSMSTQKTAARGRTPQAAGAASASATAAAPADAVVESDNMTPDSLVVEQSLSVNHQSPIITLTVEALTAHTRRTTPQLLKADNGVLFEIATWCEAPELMILSGVSSRFRGTVQAHDAYLWGLQCRSLWTGRYISSPQLIPYVHALKGAVVGVHTTAHPQVESSPPTSSADEHHLQQHNVSSRSGPGIGSWREAYVRSIAQCQKTRLSTEELQVSHWEIAFLADESIPTQAITFNTNTGVVRTQGFDPMRYQLYQQGGEMHVHVFPTQTVTRDPDTWQWVLHNPFVEIRNMTTLQAVEGSTATQAPIAAVPRMRPWFRLNSPSSHGENRRFSSCRDTELLVDASEHSSLEQALDPMSPLFHNRKQKRRGTETHQTYTCDFGEDVPFTFVGFTPTFGEESTREGFLPGGKVAGGPELEDPPPWSTIGAVPPSTSCVACSGALNTCAVHQHVAGSTAGRAAHGEIGKDGGTSCRQQTHQQQQQCTSFLSQSTDVPPPPPQHQRRNSFLENLLAEEDVLWEQMSDLHSSQQRALWSHSPSIVEGHRSEHLLDQGRPLRPP